MLYDQLEWKRDLRFLRRILFCNGKCNRPYRFAVATITTTVFVISILSLFWRKKRMLTYVIAFLFVLFSLEHNRRGFRNMPAHVSWHLEYQSYLICRTFRSWSYSRVHVTGHHNISRLLLLYFIRRLVDNHQILEVYVPKDIALTCYGLIRLQPDLPLFESRGR